MSGHGKHFYVTTPIYYVNDVPHMGHAYTTIACDALARFKRLDGFDVMFLTGTDEHGQKVEKSAAAKGVDPQAFCDDVSQYFRAMGQMLNISNDDFIRTTEDRHLAAAEALWKALADNGDIYLGSYNGWYSVRDEAFFGEDELKDGENGKKIAPTGAECEWVEEPSYFFRLSAWQDRLLAFYESHPDFIMPHSRHNEIVSFVKQGLRDLSISRTTFKWGVPVPGDDAHIMYVWLDALANYISALGYPEMAAGSKYEHFWPADVHVMGKDIIRFHAVYWPAFLMSAGLPAPKRCFAHGWWMAEGQKMSKSLGNVIKPGHLVEKYGVDQTRYFMLREVPFGQDGDFSHVAMVGRMNGELANAVGNLAQRTLSMIQKNCAGVVPTFGTFTAEDEKLLGSARALLDKLRERMETQSFHLALEDILGVAFDGNRYVDEMAPWGLKKTDPARMATVLYVLAETIRHIALALLPFVPESSGKMLDQLAVAESERTFDRWGEEGALAAGVPLPVPTPIFHKYVEEEAVPNAG
ncbi:MAG: methionine--tRNA ligase [Alphaproteobacteria bacterium GWF2_58_20]|nr:MAG: methionine--tRNA ligase [Alphaproteobacteria bacterium GWF2_58_20]